MANTIPLEAREGLRRVIEQAPLPTPTRGTFVMAEVAGLPVELRVDIRRVGEIDWAYDGPMRLAPELGASPPRLRVMEWLRKELGEACREVRVHRVADGVAEVTAFFRPLDATK